MSLSARLLSRLQQKHTSLGVSSDAYRKMVSAVFLSPNPFRSSRTAELDLVNLLGDFKKNGIVVFDESFESIAEELETKYFDCTTPENLDLQSEAYLKNLHTDDDLKAGLSSWMEISILNPIVFPLFSNERVVNLVSEYYGRQAYYRNMPVLSETSVPVGFAQDPTYKFHVDYGLKQISFMLLLKDLDETETHMMYALGSHRERLPSHMVRDRYSFADETILAKYDMFRAVGKKGTLFIFDAGNGLHRAMPVPGSTRRILHMNLTTGHYMLNQKKLGEALSKMTAPLPIDVSRAFERLRN